MKRSNPEAYAEMMAQRQQHQQHRPASEASRSTNADVAANVVGGKYVLADADYVLSMIRAGISSEEEQRTDQGVRYHVGSDGIKVFRQSDVLLLQRMPEISERAATSSSLGRRIQNRDDTERRRREASLRRAEAESRSLQRRKKSEEEKRKAEEDARRAREEASSITRLGSAREGAHAAQNKAFFMDMRAKALAGQN